MPSLPDDHVLRPPTMEDAEAVLAVVVARDVADIGHPDYSIEDVRSDWTAPGFDLQRDAWVVEDPSGTVVATASVSGDHAHVYVHPDATGRGIGSELRSLAEARARQRGCPALKQFVVGANDDARKLLMNAGYWAAQHYWRMRVELGDGSGLPEPVWPEGVDVRPFVADQDAEPVWELVQACFDEVEGNTPQTFDEWRSARIAKEGADFGTWRVATNGNGTLVGAVVNERWDDGLGYVDQLAVAPAARGRGLGRALLLSSFRQFAALGDTTAELSVHTKNRAGTRLYESVGMSTAWKAERWEKALA